jgi:hypothetical protein
MEINNINQLLTDVNRIFQHQQEIKRLKGEHFNIFSILKMESKENATHSAFLGELLDPKGSHQFENIFLKLFLKFISFEDEFDTNSATVTLEKHVGGINYEAKTGGRIDIFIKDAKGNSIAIENKIYAGDQSAQIERYVNVSNKNTVYYLTLDGNTPSEDSKGKLKEDVDFYCISYQSTITKWLHSCMKEAAEQPILRETIRQYIILIKKLTNQLTDNRMEKDVFEMIGKNYSAARLISANLWRVELHFTTKFLEELKEVLSKRLGEKAIISIADNMNEKWSKFTVSYEDWNGIIMALEGGPKIPWNDSYFGIHAQEDIWKREDLIKQFSNNKLFEGFNSNFHWAYYKQILSFEKVEEREKLFIDDQRHKLVKTTAHQMIELINECREPLTKINKVTKQ